MNFIEAARKFYAGIESRERVFVIRKAWCRSCKGFYGAYFYALGLDTYRNLRMFKMDTSGDPSYGSSVLGSDGYLADDWAVFDIGLWEIREEAV